MDVEVPQGNVCTDQAFQCQKLPGMIHSIQTVPFLSSSGTGVVKNESDGRNSDKYWTMARNFRNSVGVSGGGMFCTVLTL